MQSVPITSKSKKEGAFNFRVNPTTKRQKRSNNKEQKLDMLNSCYRRPSDKRRRALRGEEEDLIRAYDSIEQMREKPEIVEHLREDITSRDGVTDRFDRRFDIHANIINTRKIPLK